MRGKWKPGILVVFAVVGLSCAGARGEGRQQATQQASQQSARAQKPAPETDIGGSFYEAIMTPSTTGNGVTQSMQNGMGGMAEIRHLVSPLIGYELTFGLNSEKQTIVPTPNNCGYVCNEAPFTDTSRSLLWSLDWVFSKQYGRLRPFAVAGVGWYYGIPSNSIYGLNNPLRTMGVLGGGVDYAINDHWGVRGQFRGNFYTAPDPSTTFPSTGGRVHMFQPMGGVFYAF